MITTSAPGKIILFGEHAVVYDKLGIACSIDKRCNVRIFPGNDDNVFIESKDFNLTGSLSKKELFDLQEKINDLKNEKKFTEMKEVFKKNELIPSFFVVANILKNYGFKPLKIEIESDVPKNLGSSSSVFSAVSLAVLSLLQKQVSRKQISDFAFQGDLIAHGGTPSGIDNNIVTYGGFLKYRKSKGIEFLNLDFKIPLLIVDSGERTNTGETVALVRKKKKENPEFINSVLDSLNDISEKALGSLNNQDFDNLGKLMYRYYAELKKLGISTSKLDRIIDIALQNKVLGAKPTGGWGGGCCVVLAKDQMTMDDLIEVFKKNGFKSFKSRIGEKGVKLI